MSYLTYPFNPDTILRKKKQIKRELLASGHELSNKRIAILGGSTTAEIKDILELFLLHYGIMPEFYESEYAQYWQEGMFGEGLNKFTPDVVFIHTTSRNIQLWPNSHNSREQIDEMLDSQFNHFSSMWEKIKLLCKCIIIQNNFERPGYRLFGNKDVSDYRGRSNYVSRLNQKTYEYAQSNKDFYVNDIDYLSASYGLASWHDPVSWYTYKYALCLSAIPELSYSVANIIKSVYGKNKKAFALDLDNTLWGGVIGEEGMEGIDIGLETPMGQIYSEFQDYIKAHKDLGIILSICSKNDLKNALVGLRHPESVLSADDFAVVKANWENKDFNINEIEQELNISTDSLVLIDDNPAERDLVLGQIEGVAAPDIGSVEEYIQRIDQSGFFEVTSISEDDLKRGDMYKENANREKMRQNFESYLDYLKCLEMVATIEKIEPVYTQRIAQLTNKTNQFNLTTKRYSEREIIAVAEDSNYLGLYGKLADKYGDNGVVSVIIGRINDIVLHIDLWIMSCRVLKRDMELAMFDKLVSNAINVGIQKIIGYYYPSAKNSMVSELYHVLGFDKVSQDEEGNTVWEYLTKNHINKNLVITVLLNE